MIHFDWDILGVNLETFSPEMIPLQPCLDETIVKPKQVELFTSLLRQEAAVVETPSLRPTMFPQSIIMPEKPQNVRQMSANVAANAPATEDTTPSVKVPSTQIPTTQKSIAQMPVDQKPVISQTASVQEPASTPYITVKASISAPLQPTVSLENLEALESLEVLDHLAPLEIAQRPVMAAANAPSTENTRSSVEASSTQMPTTQKSFTQRPVAQMPILAQTTSAQEPASTPYTTVKASVSTLLQPTAPLESLDFLEPQVHLEPLKNLEPLETAAIAPTTENTTPSTEAPSTQMPVAQKSVSAQAESAQVSASASYITVKAPVSTPLQPIASLEKLEALESLQVLDHLEPLETAQKPVIVAANAPAMGNAKPSVETSYTQMPMVQKSVTMQTAFAQKPVIVAANAPAMENVKPSVEVPSMQMPTAQMPSMQEPVAQKPIIAQTASAQAPINTPYITAKAPVSTLLQPMAQESLLEPLVHLEPLKNLEPLETAAMATAMENAKPSVEVPYTQIHTVQVPKPQQPVIAQMPSMQIPVAQKPIIAQTASTQDPASTSYITVKASVTAPLQSTASLENLEALEVLDHLEPLETAAMVPTMENTKPSVQEPSTHVPTVQKPIIAQTLSAQESASTRYITVKAPASTLLQPTASLESLESLEVLDHPEPLEIAQKPVMAVAANAPATENTKSSVEIPFVQMPTAQKPIIARTPSTQMSVAQMPAITQMPSAQMSSMQVPIIAQTASAQMPVNTPYITVKASIAVPLQPTAPLESLVFLEPLVHLEPLKNLVPLETAAMVPTMENAKSSVQEPSVQIPMPQKPFVQILTAQAPFAELPLAQMPAVQKHVIPQTAFTQIPMAQKIITAQTLSAQELANTPYITVKASVSTLLQPTAPLESLVFLEPLVHLEPLKDLEPLETAAMAPAMENAKQPFVEMHSTQMPVAQIPAMQEPVAQKPIIAQTASAQVPANTPYITVKTSVSTLLQPTALLESLDFLEPLVHLEPLETTAMAPAMENAKPSVQEPSMQMPMPQKYVIAQTAFTQMPIAQMPVNTPYITIKASVSTLQQPTAPLEPLVHLEPLKNLEPLEIAVMAPAMENAKPSVQEASVLMPMPQPSVQMSTAQKPVIAQKPIIVQTASTQESASASYITGKVSVSAPQQPMASLENLVLLKPLESLETSAMENTKPSAQLPVAQMPVAQMPSTQVPVAHKSVTVQTSSAHVSANTPHITIKPSHSFTQKLEAPQKPHQKTSSMPDVVAPSIQAAATAISQPINLAMPSVAPVKASSIAMSPAQILSETVNELTAAIMVNIDENGHLGEIRLVLKPDVLDGTTILLKCDQKQVSVTFFPGAESAEQLIMANQNHIAETLAATGHLPVKISIINSEGRRQIRKPA